MWLALGLGVQKMNSLAELEQDFGKPRKEWSLEEWKQAAVGNSLLLDTSNELINALQEILALNKENTQHLETRIAQLENRRIGRPRELKKTLGALALYNKSKRGRPKNNYADKGSIWAYTNEDLARDLRHRVDLIKTEHWIKTDKAALTFLYKKLPLRTRTRLIEYDAKLLSKHRKLIAKIE